jgi:hypothetical protein
MVESILIYCLIIGGTFVVTIVLRDILNRKIIKRACEDAKPIIERFKQENTFVIPLNQEQRALNTVLRTTISESRRMRDEAIKNVKKIQLPNPDNLHGFPELKEMMEHNQDLFIKTMKGTYSHKIKSLLKGQVKDRIHLAKEKAKEIAKHSLSNADVAMAVAQSDASNIIYDNASNYVSPQLDIFEKKIVDFMDSLGVIDVSTVLVMQIDDWVHEHFGDATSHFLHNSVNFFDNLYDVPAGWFALQSTIREFNLIIDNETTFEDSLLHSGSAIAIKAGAIKVGLILDGMTGGLSMGLFTVGMSYISTRISNWISEEHNKELRQKLSILENEIEECRKSILYKINLVIREFEEGFAERLEVCPDINDEASINVFIGELKEVYSHGFEQAEQKLSANTRRAIECLPESKWWHKLFFINPNKAVAKLYLEAQRIITSYHSGLVHNFNLSADAHVEDGIKFLIKDVVFNTPETLAVLSKTEMVIETCSENYLESLSVWEDEIITYRKESSEKVAVMIECERKYHEVFVEERKPKMLKLMKRINANNKRQGKRVSK